MPSHVDLPDVLDVLIVGAGAAGLAAAAFVGDPSLRVVLLDGARTLGAKILVSGGGRCNVTNVRVTERDFWGGRSTIVRQILKAFPADRAAAFFAELGVSLHEEADGKLFPDSNRARDVLDALLHEVTTRGVDVRTNHRVSAISRDADGFVVTTSQGSIAAKRVVLATGGRSLPKSGSDGFGYTLAERLGHSLVATTPALAPLVLDDGGRNSYPRLSGMSHDSEIAVWVDGRVSIRLTGSLLWTHFGVSGPLALNASRHWARAVLNGSTVSVTLSAVPGASFEDVDERLRTHFAARPKASLVTLLSAFLPASLSTYLAESAGLASDRHAAQLTRDERRQLVHALVALPLAVTDTRGYGVAEATAGGVRLDEIDPTTMESRVCPGLFLVGELLDVDGRLGGFNFQWAWSTAYVAARAIARDCRDREDVQANG